MPNQKTAILILHFRDNEHTLPCLDSLKQTNPSHPFTTYVINVQCQHPEIIKNHPLKPITIDTDQNGGFAWANNVLMKQAFKDNHRIAILLNNDTTVDQDFVKPLEDQLKSTRIGLVSPKIYFYPGNEFHHDDYQESERGHVIWYMGGIFDWANVYASHPHVDEVDHGQFREVVETDFATGCCTAVTRTTTEIAGLMNEKYFLYFEDADWSLKVKQAGLKILVEPKSIIYHKNAGSTGGSGSPLQQYYQTRNRFYFGMQFAPLKTKLHLIKNALKTLTDKNPTLKQAARDALLHRLGQREFAK